MALPDTLALLTTPTPTLVQIKDDGSINTIEVLGSTDEGALGADIYRSDRTVAYRGGRYALGKSSGANLGVYKAGTGLVGLAAAGTPVGLFLVNAGTGAAGKQRLVAVGTNAGQVVYDYTDDGVTWNGAASVGSAVNPPAGPAIVFDEKIYWPMPSSGNAVARFDPVALTATRITPPWLSTAPPGNSICNSFEVLDGTKYALAPTTTPGTGTTNWAIYAWTGSGYTFNTAITADNPIGARAGVADGQCLLRKIPGANKLLAICPGSSDNTPTNAGTRAWELTPSGGAFTVVEITNSFIPVGLRPGARPGFSAEEDRIMGMTVNDDDPTVVELFILIAEGVAPGAGGYSIYKFVNASTVLSLHAVGPSPGYALPSCNFGGGARVDIGGGNQVTIEYDQPVPTGWEIGFRVEGPIAGQSMGVFASQDKETPMVLASLLSQTGSGGLAANRVTGVNGDSGATLRTVVVDLAASGIPKKTGLHYKLDLQ